MKKRMLVLLATIALFSVSNYAYAGGKFSVRLNIGGGCCNSFYGYHNPCYNHHMDWAYPRTIYVRGQPEVVVIQQQPQKTVVVEKCYEKEDLYNKNGQFLRTAYREIPCK